ncbi:unnamed protein product [marine sediment metagenome]|uniref:Uncharacterized protein n=1 Tax=marine sediment metagenome TaxID=412755 RepID=X0SIJ5_9ZZZZ
MQETVESEKEHNIGLIRKDPNYTVPCTHQFCIKKTESVYGCLACKEEVTGPYGQVIKK